MIRAPRLHACRALPTLPTMSRLSVMLVTLLASSAPAAACPSCRPTVEAAIYDDSFWSNVGLTLLPFVVVALIIAVIEGLNIPQSAPPKADPSEAAVPRS